MLGRGGMGEVRTAYDPRLGRDVAVKTVQPGDRRASSLLAHEARITARLEHPGIMPVYAAGVDASGRPWYAMRQFEGRSLADRLAAAPDLPARLRLVRHVLEMSEAVAYAHEQGILHRDLKPANVMTGQFGETLVGDWGLACTFAEAAEARGGGTPGYSSPEQLAGAVCDERSDVYGLGATLHELLAGAPPGHAALPADAPPELAAVARRALQPDPAARYPSAKAFAADLLAWFEGRRVTALEYRLVDVARLALRAWRVPLRWAAVAGAIFVVGLAGSGWRAAAERARAVVSEAATAQARADEAVAFAAALRAQAATALAAGLTLEPRILAAEALARHDDADGRGMLAAVYGRHLLDRVRDAVPIPECTRRALSLQGTRAACTTGSELRLYDGATGTLLARAPSDAIRLDFAGNDTDVVAITPDGRIWWWRPPAAPLRLDATPSRSGGGEIGDSLVPGLLAVTRDTSEVLVDLRGAAPTHAESRACVNAVVKATAIDAQGRLIVGCHDGRVMRVENGDSHMLFRVASADGVPYRIVPHPDGRLFVGTYTGRAMAWSADGELLASHKIGEDGVWAAAWKGDDVFVTDADGTEVLWDTHADVVKARLALRFTALAWLADGTLRVFGDTLGDRAADAPPRPAAVDLGAGVTSVAWAPDGSRVAASLGDGRAVLVDPAGLLPPVTLTGDPAVAKDVAFSGDGASVFVARSGGPLRRYAPDGRLLDDLPIGGGRRVAWVDGVGVLYFQYGPRVVTWRLGEAPVLHRGRGFTDLEVDPDGRHAVALTADESVWVLDGADPDPTFRWVATRRLTTGVAAIGDHVLLSTADELEELDRDGNVHWRVALPSQACALASSPDHTRVAVGFLDGTTSIYRRGGSAPVARLVGHHARLGGVAFSADGRWLATAAWDGGLRLWAMDALSVDVAVARTVIPAASGLALADVLRTMDHAP